MFSYTSISCKKIFKNTLLVFILILFLPLFIFSQNSNLNVKTIHGNVTHLNASLSDVHVINKTKKTGVKTDNLGKYSIKAQKGDELQFSYIGFKTVTIVIEEITTVLNIEMQVEINELDEAIVTVKKSEREAYEDTFAGEKKFKIVGGDFHPNGPYQVGFVNGKDIHSSSFTLGRLLVSKVANVTIDSKGDLLLRHLYSVCTPLWDLDGIISEEEPLISFKTIKDIYVVHSAGFVKTHYGRGECGVVIIRTIGGPYDDTKTSKENIAKQYINKKYYKDDAVSNYNDYSKNNSNLFKEIYGKVTNKNAVLTDVHVLNKTQNKVVKTNTQGYYAIKAKPNDILQFSYVGMKTLTIVIEDVTSVLNIEMITNINKLKEAVVYADKKPGKELERALKSEEKFATSMGSIDPKKSGFSIGYIDGIELLPGYAYLSDAINGRIASVEAGNGNVIISGYPKPAIWDVDGVITDSEPLYLVGRLGDIKDIHILKAGTSGVKYGIKGRYGVVVVRTNGASFDAVDKKENIAKKYTNKNYYNNDAKINYSNYSQENATVLKEIKGKITYKNTPLPDANILNIHQNKGTKSNVQGNYSIYAKPGDILQFSYVGFKTLKIIIEDITSVLNIEMEEEILQLDETVVQTNTKGKESKRSRRANKKFKSSKGWFNPKSAGYEVVTVEGQELNLMNVGITQALVGKIAGYTVKNNQPYLRGANMSVTQDYPAIWDVDGSVYTSEPPLDISQIKNIKILKSLSAVNRYGTMANGGVIIIKTIQNAYANNEAKAANNFTNQKYYYEDAFEINKESFITNKYTKKITGIKIKQKAFAFYTDSLKSKIKEYSTHIGIAQDFNNYYKDKSISLQILKDLALKHQNNPEILKSIAFQMQAYKFKKETIDIYKRIFKIRPNYAQSLRDLANAYTEDQQFNKAWKLYISYLFQGNDLSGEGIGQLVYNEMEWLYFNKKDKLMLNVQFEPKSKDVAEFRNDVRFVFEWNTSEAEFDLEFVNPQKQVYTFEHSLYKSQNMINDEKEKGYSSKEFIIDDVKQGQWLVNLTYNGNKKPDPTYLKVTTYYFWGKPNQHQKTDLYKLDKTHKKIQLYRVNKQLLVVAK